MKVDAKQYANFLGFAIQGDLGDLTMYRNANHLVVIYPMTWPKEQPTALQNYRRDLFRQIAAAWRDLPPAARAAWLIVAVKAHLRIQGYNLFTFWMMRGDRAAIATLERQTNTNLQPLPDPLPADNEHLQYGEF